MCIQNTGFHQNLLNTNFLEFQCRVDQQKLLVIRYKLSMSSYDIVTCMTIVHQFMYPKICEFYQIHKIGCQRTLTKPQCVYYLKYQFSSAMKSTFKLMPNEQLWNQYVCVIELPIFMNTGSVRFPDSSRLQPALTDPAAASSELL